MFDFDDDDYIVIGLSGWTEECGRAAEHKIVKKGAKKNEKKNASCSREIRGTQNLLSLKEL